MGQLRHIWLYLFVIIMQTCFHYAESWWLMAQMSASNVPTNYCNAMPGLSRRQRTLCFQHPQATRALHKGLRLAFDECRSQFAHERWNCSVDGGFGLALKMASAEVAFLYAITAAGASHELARECARGTISDCGCGENPLRIPPLALTNPHTVSASSTLMAGQMPTDLYGSATRPYLQSKYGENGRASSYYSDISASAPSISPYYPPTNPTVDFTWAGCSHNVKYANSFSRKFVDSTEKQHMDARALMNLHNNRVGRKALASNLRRQCKCHGVSGSCVTKTCWSVVPTIDELGTILKQKYERAHQVAVLPGELAKVENNPSGRRRSEDYSRPHRSFSESTSVISYRAQPSLPASRGDLVFLESSPDYCVRNDAHEVPGTVNRECTSPEECTRLCCGRGWRVEREFREEPCRCHFIWCCEVKCDMCVREVERLFCK